MKITFYIPDEEIRKEQCIIPVDFHFIDGKLCGCDYPFDTDESTEKVKKEHKSEWKIVVDVQKFSIIETYDFCLDEYDYDIKDGYLKITRASDDYGPLLIIPMSSIRTFKVVNEDDDPFVQGN